MKKKKSLFFPILILCLVGIVGFLISFLKIPEGKLVLAMSKEDGGVTLAVFDFKRANLTEVEIPPETQMQVSRQLGTWKLGSIWQLGEDEQIGGELLRETLMKTLKVPVNEWSEERSHKTGLSFKQKVFLEMFSSGIKNITRSSTDIYTLGYATKTKLNDGSEGYVIKERIPPEMALIFSDEEITSQSLNISIVDSSGRGVAEELSQLIEVIGAKVVSTKTTNIEKGNCKIYSVEKKLKKVLSDLFFCDIGKDEPSGSYELEIVVGKDFIL